MQYFLQKLSLCFLFCLWIISSIHAQSIDINQNFLPKNNTDSIKNYHSFKYEDFIKKNLHNELVQYYWEQDYIFNISLPINKQTQISFNVVNSHNISRQLHKQYPYIYTLKGFSENKRYKIRVTLNNNIILGIITDTYTKERWKIQYKDDFKSGDLMVFNIKEEATTDVLCYNIEDNHTIHNNSDYRFAEKDVDLNQPHIVSMTTSIFATYEFNQACGGSVNNTAIIINNIVNQVSDIYERDLGVRIINNNLHIRNSSTIEPINALVSTLTNPHEHYINASRVFWSNVNGNNRTDIGHVFSIQPGGLAYVDVICQNSNSRYGASSGTTAPLSESFVLTVAHEIGHQIGARHSHAALIGRCDDLISSREPWEIGGGSSIMSYAGVCAPLSYQNSQSNYFHAGSIKTMYNKIHSSSCIPSTYGLISRDDYTQNRSQPDFIPITQNHIIPINTPFRLSIPANDLDNDLLTYSIEQVDKALTGMTTVPTGFETSGPLFRYYEPTRESTKYFPPIYNHANRNINSYNIIPQVPRRLNFKGIVRDNHAEVGRHSLTDISIQVVNTDSFAFTNHLGNETYIADGANTITLTWSTSNTLIQGNVNIRFSIDGGATFPHLLVANTPNDGSETFIVPNFDICSGYGKFMIEAIDHIAYNINAGQINISSANKLSAIDSIFPDNSLSINLNHPDLQINTQIPTGIQVQFPITKQLSTNTGNRFSSINNTTNTCTTFGISHNIDTITIYPSISGMYSFSLSPLNSNISLGLEIHKGNYAYNNSTSSTSACGAIIYNSKIHNSSNQVSLPVVTNQNVYLCKGERYTIVVHNFSTSSGLPEYTLDITGALLYNSPAVSQPTYHNGFVIYEANTGIIHDIKTNTDMSDANNFPLGKYIIKGINSSISIFTLANNYRNQSFSTLQQAIYNQTNNLDASLSPNQRIITITAPLPIRLINWSGIVNEESQSVLSWSSIEDELFDYYTIESSTDGQTFTTVSNVAKQSTDQIGTIQRYQFTDQNFKHYPANTVFYRLKINNKDGQQDYTKVIALHKKNEATHSSIYPNPVKKGDNLRVKVAANNDYQITITNTVGQIIKHDMIATNQNELTISTKELKAGVYFISIHNDHITEQHKFVVTQ